MNKLKRLSVVLLMISVVFFSYVAIVNRNSNSMTARQKLLKTVYPLFIASKKIFGKQSLILSNKNTIPPPQSFFDLSIQMNDGSVFSFRQLEGKKVLLVNTASDCGFTAQYDDLQKVQDQFNNLQVIGFPSNDFKQQEKGTDEEIGAFCRKNFGITFPLASRSIVIKSARQNEVYQWLTDKKEMDGMISSLHGILANILLMNKAG